MRTPGLGWGQTYDWQFGKVCFVDFWISVYFKVFDKPWKKCSQNFRRPNGRRFFQIPYNYITEMTILPAAGGKFWCFTHHETIFTLLRAKQKHRFWEFPENIPCIFCFFRVCTFFLDSQTLKKYVFSGFKTTKKTLFGILCLALAGHYFLPLMVQNELTDRIDWCSPFNLY